MRQWATLSGWLIIIKANSHWCGEQTGLWDRIFIWLNCFGRFLARQKSDRWLNQGVLSLTGYRWLVVMLQFACCYRLSSFIHVLVLVVSHAKPVSNAELSVPSLGRMGERHTDTLALKPVQAKVLSGWDMVTASRGPWFLAATHPAQGRGVTLC